MSSEDSAVGHHFAHRHVHGVVLRRVQAKKVMMVVVRQFLVAAQVAACLVVVHRVSRVTR